MRLVFGSPLLVSQLKGDLNVVHLKRWSAAHAGVSQIGDPGGWFPVSFLPNHAVDPRLINPSLFQVLNKEVRTRVPFFLYLF